MGEPVVSIVVPAYKSARWLPDAVAGFCEQTLHDWECVIVDDASPDENTRAVARQLAEDDPRVRAICHDTNQGVGGALNTGVRASAGRYVQTLGADDLIEPRKLELQAAFLDAHPDVGFVYGDARYFDDGHPDQLRRHYRDDREWMPLLSGGRDVMLPALVRTNILPFQAGLIRAEVFDEVGLFDARLVAHEDYEMCLRMAAAGVRFVYAPAPGSRVLLRTHASSLTANLPVMWETLAAVRESTNPLLPRSLQRLNRSLQARDLRRLANVQDGRRKRARTFVRAALTAPYPRQKIANSVRAARALVGA